MAYCLLALSHHACNGRYHVEVTKPGADAPDVAVLPGNQTHLTLREVNRSPLHPLEQVVLNVSYVHAQPDSPAQLTWLAVIPSLTHSFAHGCQLPLQVGRT